MYLYSEQFNQLHCILLNVIYIQGTVFSPLHKNELSH